MPTKLNPTLPDDTMAFDRHKKSTSNELPGPSLGHTTGGSYREPSQQMNQNPIQHTQIDLARKLRKSRRSSAYAKAERVEFLPISELDSIINHENIRSHQAGICPEITDAELHNLIQSVRDDNKTVDRRRIFAILALIKKTDSISDFTACGINDSHLPLEFSWKSGEYEVVRPGDDRHIALFDGWSELDCEAFRSSQRCMLAPVFHSRKDRIKVHTIGQHSVLPFLEYEKMGEGGYGNVFKVKIHPSHHTFPPSVYSNDENPYFAVKTLRLNGRKEFDQEVEALTKVSCVAKPNPHLIQLRMAYEIGDTYHLLFDCADGNLRQYWETNKNQSKTLERAHWFIEQCVGLAGGLRKIHRVRTSLWNTDGKSFPPGAELEKSMGRHGDLKPENILCFQKNGKVQLVISDFGFSRYHSPESQSSDIVAGWTGAYRPPECDLKQSITQRYDIWTLGCVFLIFVSWFVLDYKTGVEMFANKRAEDDIPIHGQLFKEDKFFNIEDGKPRIKTSVKDWMSKIKATETCPPFVKDFLGLIEEGLLVAPSGGRWNSDRIWCRLMQIKKECDASAAYCLVRGTDVPRGTLNIPMIIQTDDQLYQHHDTQINRTSNPPNQAILEDQVPRHFGRLKKARFGIDEFSERRLDEIEWNPSVNKSRSNSNSQKSSVNQLLGANPPRQDATSSSGASDDDGSAMDTAVTTPLIVNENTKMPGYFSNKLYEINNHTLRKSTGPYQPLIGDGMMTAAGSTELHDSGITKCRRAILNIERNKYWALLVIGLLAVAYAVFSRGA